MLLHIPDVLDAARLGELRQALATADWSDGRATVGAQGAQVKHNEQLPDAAPLRQRLGAIVLDAVSRSPLFHAATLPAHVFPPRFNRYRDGGEYGFHVDGAVMALATPGAPMQQLRSDVSCTLFLSEPDGYDGGELVIQDTYGEQSVKFAAGEMVLYPASSLHRVEPVTRGSRWAWGP